MIQFPEPVPFSLPYPGERLKWACEVLGWTHTYAAWRMDMNKGSFGQMLAGKRYIPDSMGYWFETMARFHLAYPKPYRWNEPRIMREPNGIEMVGDPKDRLCDLP